VTETDLRMRRAEALFHEISALDEARRPEAVDRLCASDPDLGAEVRSLLDHSARVGRFLEEPALGGDFALWQADEEPASEAPGRRDEMLGQTIDRYRIERRIASGGMGTVYLAMRADQQFTQRVALKIVKRGMDSRRSCGASGASDRRWRRSSTPTSRASSTAAPRPAGSPTW
jgi:hypothetical protein